MTLAIVEAKISDFEVRRVRIDYLLRRFALGFDVAIEEELVVVGFLQIRIGEDNIPAKLVSGFARIFGRISQKN
jgi:hypothetical protein